MSKQEKEQVEENEIVAEERALDVEAAPAKVEESDGSTTEVPAAEATETPPITSQLEEQLEQARQEAARNLENWQRSAAELANFKRRQEEQAKLQRDRIKADVIQGLLSALDDLNLAFQNLPEELNGQLLGWVEGFRLVQRKLDKILDEQNVLVINTEGKFDPNYHEAVSVEESAEHNEGDIIGEVRKGYQIGNRVIRPALVRVAK